MLIFISGSVNSGKTTTSKLVAKKLNFEWLDLDVFCETIPNFELERDIPKVVQAGIQRINKLDGEGKSIVANYVLRPEDYMMLQQGLTVAEQSYFTLAPTLEVAQRDKGRKLSSWEYQRVKYHYDTGIATPNFGRIIDTTDMTIEQAAQAILDAVSA